MRLEMAVRIFCRSSNRWPLLEEQLFSFWLAWLSFLIGSRDLEGPRNPVGEVGRPPGRKSKRPLRHASCLWVPSAAVAGIKKGGSRTSRAVARALVGRGAFRWAAAGLLGGSFLNFKFLGTG